MITGKCIVCGNKCYHKYEILCRSKKCKFEAFKNPQKYIKKIDNKYRYKEKLKKKIEKFEKEAKKTSRELGRYKLRRLVSNNKTGDAYGITLPESVWMKYKGYKCKLHSNGVICLIPRKR